MAQAAGLRAAPPVGVWLCPCARVAAQALHVPPGLQGMEPTHKHDCVEACMRTHAHRSYDQASHVQTQARIATSGRGRTRPQPAGTQMHTHAHIL